jgi:hypothetical protein
MRKTTERAAHLLIDEEQAAVIRSVFEMFASGHHSLNAILRSLERQRVPTVKGKSKWHISTVCPQCAENPFPAKAAASSTSTLDRRSSPGTGCLGFDRAVVSICRSMRNWSLVCLATADGGAEGCALDAGSGSGRAGRRARSGRLHTFSGRGVSP